MFSFPSSLHRVCKSSENRPEWAKTSPCLIITIIIINNQWTMLEDFAFVRFGWQRFLHNGRMGRVNLYFSFLFLLPPAAVHFVERKNIQVAPRMRLNINSVGWLCRSLWNCRWDEWTDDPNENLFPERTTRHTQCYRRVEDPGTEEIVERRVYFKWET